jgi:hypothetical protein
MGECNRSGLHDCSAGRCARPLLPFIMIKMPGNRSEKKPYFISLITSLSIRVKLFVSQLLHNNPSRLSAGGDVSSWIFPRVPFYQSMHLPLRIDISVCEKPPLRIVCTFFRGKLVQCQITFGWLEVCKYKFGGCSVKCDKFVPCSSQNKSKKLFSF